jgi:UDP-N-acetyl-2-amino-2-deoxyglucuronate dehydrogenase
MTPVRIGMVGCGAIGQIHADGLAKLAAEGEVVPVIAADPSADARDAALRNCPFSEAVDDPQAVFEHEGIDALFITTPTRYHASAVDAALGRGLALLCEKPLATSFDEVTRLAGAVAGSPVVAQVGFHSRFNPMFCRLHELVTSGQLGRVMGYVLREDQFWPTGDVVAGHSSWRSDPTASGGGALVEHTIHGCDLVSWMFGPAVSVSARTRSLFDFGVEDVATVHVQHRSEVIGTIATVFNGVEGREERRLEVFFEYGAVEVTGDFIVGAGEDALTIHRPRQPADRVDIEALRDETFTRWGISRRDFIFYQYLADRAFIRCVRSGEAATPGFADALTAHALVDAAYRSAAAEGRPTTPSC